MDFSASLRAVVSDLVSPMTLATDMRRSLEDLRSVRTKEMKLPEQWRQPLALLNICTLLSDSQEPAHRDIEQAFSTMQSDSELQETLMLSCYAVGKWVESFQLAKDLLASKPSVTAYQVALHLACNRFFMPKYALHIATLATEAYPDQVEFAYALAVAFSLCGDAAGYYSEKMYYWQLAARSFEALNLPKCSLHLALVSAQMGDFDTALTTAVKGLLETGAAELSALMALVQTSEEDFTEADLLVHNALVRDPNNLLLHTVALVNQFELFKVTKTNVQSLEHKAIRLLRLVAGEVVDDSSSSGADEKHSGLSPIQEESLYSHEVEPQEVLKRLEFDSENLQVQEVLFICAEIFIECELKEKARTILEKLKTDTYLHALYEYTFGQKQNAKSQLIMQLEGLPESAKAQEMLGRLYYELGKKEQAMAACKLALKLGGPRRTSLLVVGNLYHEAELEEKAAETALAAIHAKTCYFHLIPKWL